jgi:hypothetical protein
MCPTLRHLTLTIFWRITVKNSTTRSVPQLSILKTALVLAFAASAVSASASENYRTRQSPIGAFGGEIAAGADNPGLFGTAAITRLDIASIVDSNGFDITTPTTATLTTAPLAGYTLNAPGNKISFHQTQTQVNLVGGYLTESTYADGRIAMVVNVPLITISRSFVGALATGSLRTPTGITLPAAYTLPGTTVNPTSLANAGASAQWASSLASQNVDVSGMGDTELSTVWIRHQDRLKVAAGVSLFLPTGNYDKTRGPNPGYGKFYTVRPGVAVTYNLNPNHKDESWDAGVTLAGRISYGINSTNTETDYRSGNFVYTEVGLVKVVGNWAFGGNLLSTQQVTNDTSPVVGTSCLGSVDAAGCRYKTYGVGPFLAYKLPGKDAGFNLQYNENFGGSNAVVVKSWQLRAVKAW